MSDATCWTLIEHAAGGEGAARDTFVQRYLPVVRAYLDARFGARLSNHEIEDALQEVFVECLRDEGVLQRNQGRRGQGFRPYLFGAVRNIARRVEAARARKLDTPRTDAFDVDIHRAYDETASKSFDRAWAASIMQQAAERLGRAAHDAGPDALRRVELLRLVFQEERRVADVAREWGASAEQLHRDYARARREFAGCLREVVAFHNPGSDAAIERECVDLIGLLA